MISGGLLSLVPVAHILELAASRWREMTLHRREIWLTVSLALSSLISFAPFARDASISNYLIYAILPIILVLANKERSKEQPFPSGTDLLVSVGLIVGSLVFNYLTGLYTGDYTYGLTDYVILVVGILSLYYSVFSWLTQMGGLLLFILRSVTLGLSAAYSSAFVTVSGFFVGIVVFFSRIFISGDIHSGYLPGEIVVGGQAGSVSVFIGWACAGLEELALISVILYVLVTSFALERRQSGIWMVIGIAGSFIINIVRMTVLVWVAHTYGIEEMHWAHTHLGDVLFLVWIALFWFVFFRVAVRGETAGSPRHGN
jgi:exosortase/archaeosortase family protein